MVFSSYEELMAAVEQRRKELLTLEVELGGSFSQEHEDAKKELQQAQAMQTLAGGQGFLGDNIDVLKQRVLDTKPEAPAVWIQFEKLDLNEWAALVKASNMTPIDQYERVLPKTFKGVFGQDPVQPDDWDEQHPDEVWQAPEPLTTNPLSVSSHGGAVSILPGGILHSVVQAFMTWQNSGGDVTIRPTKSGLV
jgi:hypothetical protein